MGQLRNPISAALLLLLPLLIQAATIPNGENAKAIAKNFKFLGSYNSAPTRRGTTISAVTSYYYFSVNEAIYSTAISDCKAFLGEDASLISIETREELENVTKLIRDSDSAASSYWLGGRYEPTKANFVWESGVGLGPWAPWDEGHPNTKLPLTRVYASTVGSIKFRTQFNTEAERFICELKIGDEEEEAEPCYNNNDLLIAVDSSGSIGQGNYLVALEFASRLAAAWADNPQNRLGVLIYSSSVRSIINLSQNLSVSEIKAKIYSDPYDGGSTNSHLALNEALQEFQRHPRSVPLNLVFMTDGGSNDPAATASSAQSLTAAGVRSFSVGIGAGINAAELLAIAGNESTRVFNTEGFDDLLRLLQPVSRKVCE